MNISLFERLTDIDKPVESAIDLFLEDVKGGKWQDQVLAVHGMSKEDRESAKKRLPLVTISGRFSARNRDSLIKHSGFICLDIDDLEDVNEVKSIICPDQYVYSAFASASGKGLAVLIKINGDRHLEAFYGLQQYFYEKFRVTIDDKCKDVVRARFVSWDPSLYLNDNSEVFKDYIKKEKPKKIEPIIFVESDFEEMVKEIMERRIDITGSYGDWLKIGFAISSKFGAAGADYFHAVSQFYPLYDYAAAEKQYKKCVNNGRDGINIASFYWLCKQAGITTMSDRTRMIAKAAASQHRAGVAKAAIAGNLEKSEGFPEDETNPIIDQVVDQGVKVEDVGLTDTVEAWLNKTYVLRNNVITNRIEVDGIEMDDSLLCEVWRQCSKTVPKASKDMIHAILSSTGFAAKYNPFLDFIAANQHRVTQGHIRRLFASVPSTDPEFLEYFGLRWLAGIIESMHGGYSTLELVLSGIKNSGKTYFLEHLLPEPLLRYVTRIGKDAFGSPTGQRDLQLRACDHLLLIDDEMPDYGKRDQDFMKALLDTPLVTTRRSHGRYDERRRRVAVYAGTTNKKEILHDSTGNRRVLPVELTAYIDRAVYNSVDKSDLLMEVYWLWKSGAVSCRLDAADVARLEGETIDAQVVTLEEEYLLRHYSGDWNTENVEYVTFGEIWTHLSHLYSLEKITEAGFRKAMHKQGWKPRHTMIGGRQGKFYSIRRIA